MAVLGKSLAVSSVAIGAMLGWGGGSWHLPSWGSDHKSDSQYVSYDKDSEKYKKLHYNYDESYKKHDVSWLSNVKYEREDDKKYGHGGYDWDKKHGWNDKYDKHDKKDDKKYGGKHYGDDKSRESYHSQEQYKANLVEHEVHAEKSVEEYSASHESGDAYRSHDSGKNYDKGWGGHGSHSGYGSDSSGKSYSASDTSIKAVSEQTNVQTTVANVEQNTTVDNNVYVHGDNNVVNNYVNVANYASVEQSNVSEQYSLVSAESNSVSYDTENHSSYNYDKGYGGHGYDKGYDKDYSKDKDCEDDYGKYDDGKYDDYGHDKSREYDSV